MAQETLPDKKQAVLPSVFCSILSSIYSKGFVLARAVPDGVVNSSYSFPTQKDEEGLEFFRCPSRTTSSQKEKQTRDTSSSDSEEFEIDIDKEQKAVYDAILDQGKQKDSESDSLFQKQLKQASNPTRRLSYDEFVRDGRTFDHLSLALEGSFYREAFAKVGILPEKDDLVDVFSCKAGPSSLVFLDGSLSSSRQDVCQAQKVGQPL